ncbi:MAG: hypothetical protein HYW57_00690 [Ignavibacteriales bacterium]|nr:hypothetical protein [Ignavibacteriales bacterium]
MKMYGKGTKTTRYRFLPVPKASVSMLCLGFLFFQSSAQGVSTSVRISDWGIGDFSQIRLGQLSIVHAPAGEELRVQALYDSVFYASEPVVPRDRNCVTVADFSTPFINRLGGSYAVFQLGGSSASITHPSEPSENASLMVHYSRVAGNPSGFWMHLFNSAFPRFARRYFDATRSSALHIPIRSNNRVERITLKIADDVWNEKEDAMIVGDLNKYLPRGMIDTAWQTAVIPLAALPEQINSARLATLVLEPVSPASGAFELGPITVCSKDAVRITGPPGKAAHTHRRENAMWIWNTAELTENKKRADVLIDFLRDQRIDHVFLALPYDASEHGEGVNIDRPRLAPLVRSLNAAAVKVHALLGDKDFVLPHSRSFVLNSMNNIVQYQRTVHPGEQFYGIHVDIEPHLLPGFNSPRQEWFLTNFIEVLAACAGIARDGGLIIGADLPTWLDAANELTHLSPEISRQGVIKPAYQHVLDLMDLVVLMDYRTNVQGDDGIVLHAREELRYAEQRGVRIFVGLETAPLLDETLIRFRGAPVNRVTDGSGQYVVLSPGEDLLSVSLVSGAEAGEMLKRPRIVVWPVERAIPLPASRLSFARSGIYQLAQVVTESEPILSQWKSFAGFAFHHYESYRSLLRK